MKLIIGLGNPGARYQHTRHNAGWMAVDRLAESLGVGGYEVCCQNCVTALDNIWLAKPLTFMNRSGAAVAAAVEATGVGMEELLVLVDDVNLLLGTIRLRRGGSSGGHKGLESVADALGTEAFPRLRMGVGSAPGPDKQVEYVLSEFDEQEEGLLDQMLARVERATRCWLERGIEEAMSRYNGPAAENESPQREATEAGLCEL